MLVSGVAQADAVSLDEAAAEVHASSSGKMVEIYTNNDSGDLHYFIGAADGTQIETDVDPSSTTWEQVGAKVCDYTKTWQFSGGLFCVAL